MATGAPIPPSTEKPKTSGLAIASLILALLGLCTFGLSSIVGLILGIIGLKKIKAGGGAVGGRGLAMAGIIISVLTLILGLVLGVIGGIAIFRGATGGMDMVTQMKCENNLRQLCTAAIMYSNENKGEFPPAAVWPSVLKESGHIPPGGDILTCPSKAGAGRTYAMNAKLGGMHIDQVRNPSQTVMFFECSPGAPPSGGPSDLPPEPPHASGWVIGFCDGHTEMVPLNRRDQLIWDPKTE